MHQYFLAHRDYRLCLERLVKRDSRLTVLLNIPHPVLFRIVESKFQISVLSKVEFFKFPRSLSTHVNSFLLYF